MSFKPDEEDHGLGAMYKPPSELQFMGTFHQAKKEGERLLKHLVVNIQDVKEFASHVLNRDTWSNKELKQLLREKCVFWQQYQTSPEGQEFTRFYPRGELPQVAILDPRTGELLHNWSGIDFKGLPPGDVASKLREIFRDHPLETPAAIKRRRDAERKEAQAGDAEEEAQIAAAIAASLGEPQTGGSSDQGGASSQEGEPSTKRAKVTNGVASGNGAQCRAPAAEVVVLDDDPPQKAEAKDPPKVEKPVELAANTPGTTKIRFRLPDHTCVVHRFLLSDTVAKIHNFVNWKVPESCSREYELALSFPAKILDDRDQTLEDAGLKGVQVLVNYVGDVDS